MKENYQFKITEHLPGKKHYGKIADTTDFLDAFTDAGFVMPEDVIVVDIDNLPKHKIRAILDQFEIVTQTVWTDRGAHLYFEKPEDYRRLKRSGFTPLGINVEYKHSGNTRSITIKLNGQLRNIENKGTITEFPDIFTRIAPPKTPDFEGLNENRNSALYAHKHLIARRASNWPKCLSFINYTLFDEPLLEYEFEAVSREEDFSKIDKTKEPEVAEFIAKELNIVFYNGDLFYNNGSYFVNDYLKFRKIVSEKYCPGMHTKYIDEVIKQINYRFITFIKNNDIFPIKFKNGFLHEGKFLEATYSSFTPYYIDHAYNPQAAEIPEITEFLNFITNSDKDYQNLMLEMMAYIFVTDPIFIKKLSKFFILIGNGGNGKGVLVNIMQQIIGSNNYSTTPFHTFEKSTDLYNLNGKLVNFDDDMVDTPITQRVIAAIKSISTADEVMIRKLYSQGASARLITTLIGTSNHLVKSYEKSDAFKRRIMWMPMYNDLSVYKANSLFFKNLYQTEEAINYWLRLIIEAYDRLYENSDFTKSDMVENFNEKYFIENDNTVEFARSLSIDDFINTPVADIKREYKAFCELNDYKPLSIRNLDETLENEFSLIKKNVRRNGYAGWHYVRK